MTLDRRNQIVEMITRQRTVKNSELMERFGISIETVRRDLAYLEERGYLRRVYGGAVANDMLGGEPEYESRSQLQLTEKEAIGAAAAAMVESREAVYMGVGTTVQAMVSGMKELQGVTVFTNALRTAVELSELPGCTVVLTGGQLRGKELTLSGFPADENMANFNVDKAFIGVGGITEEGVTDFHIGEAQLHRAMVRNAKTAIALCDSSKLGVRAMNHVCPISQIDVLITDSKAPAKLLQQFKKAGVRVIVADA